MGKKITLRLIIIVAIVLALILAIIIPIMDNKETENAISQEVDTPLNPMNSVLEINSISTNINITACVNAYLSYNANNNEKAIYGLLIEDYKNEEKITEDNVISKIYNINYVSEFIINKVYSYEAELGITTYFVYGEVLNKENKTKEEFDVVINIDNVNKTFELAPMGKVYEEYVDYSNYNNIKVKESIEKEIKKIEPNIYNQVNEVNGLRR